MISLAWEGDWPISQLFGVNPHYYRRFGLEGHEGIDIACPVGTPVRAINHSWCVEVGLGEGAYGYYVKLRGHGGEEWVWAHLLPYRLPRPGEWVEPGDRIGFTGESGNTMGAHLHIGYRPAWWDRQGGFIGFTDPLPHLA